MLTESITKRSKPTMKIKVTDVFSSDNCPSYIMLNDKKTCTRNTNGTITQTYEIFNPFYDKDKIEKITYNNGEWTLRKTEKI